MISTWTPNFAFSVHFDVTMFLGHTDASVLMVTNLPQMVDIAPTSTNVILKPTIADMTVKIS